MKAAFLCGILLLCTEWKIMCGCRWLKRDRQYALLLSAAKFSFINYNSVSVKTAGLAAACKLTTPTLIFTSERL